MPVSQDDLLIFKVREQEKGAAKKKVGAQTVVIQTTRVEQPAAAQPKPIQQPQPVAQPRPVQQQPAAQPRAVQQVQPPPQQPKEAVQQPRPEAEQAQRVAARPVQQPVQQPRPAAQPQQPAKEQRVAVEEARPVVLTPYVEPHYEEPKAETTYLAAPEYEGNVIDASLNVPYGTGAYETPQEQRKINKRKMSTKEMRKIAEHMSCDLHPWRKAYAICDYCGRAFCYEDVMEHNGSYYCLDDIANIPKLELETAANVRYTNMRFISVALMLAIAGVFGYFSHAGVAALLAPPFVLAKLTFTQKLLSAEALLALVSVLTALLVASGVRASFKIAVVTQLATIVVFSYQFLVLPASLSSTNLVYGSVIGLSFVSLIVLAYSRVSEEPLVEEANALAPSHVGGAPVF